MKTQLQTAGKSIPSALLLGACAAMIWSAVWAVITAKMVEANIIPFEAIGYAVMLIHLTSSAIASTLAWARAKRNRIQLCLGAGGIYYVSLLAAAVLFFGGNYTGMGTAALLVVIGSLVPVLPAVVGKGRGLPVRYKYRTA